MRSISHVFCEVCKEEITKQICKLIDKEYDFNEFFEKNPIGKDHNEIKFYNPLNCYNEKVTPYDLDTYYVDSSKNKKI